MRKETPGIKYLLGVRNFTYFSSVLANNHLAAEGMGAPRGCHLLKVTARKWWQQTGLPDSQICSLYAMLVVGTRCYLSCQDKSQSPFIHSFIHLLKRQKEMDLGPSQ